ncbi:MAG: prepilin-type N-terminal cleavage/methylation domain-containing protein [Candidatus Omnitrophica bacterium]|nr:prepilin-type N-terminal cleavage/methylation domain-containing protein [Candidatus Omnitrophota bacterium]MDD5436782.1 prepilin-type N-terminal cleavage/methylation domain-containing protein [Candidatus Omnitrophota bacterium]
MKKAFTLIELIIVIVIVSILASIAAPIMMGTQNKAIKAEAYAALGAIRSAERLYFIEYGEYASVDDFSDPNNALGRLISPGDLNGQYFSEECYSISSVSPLRIGCYPSLSDPAKSPGAPIVRTWTGIYVIIMDENGNIWEYPARDPYSPEPRLPHPSSVN